MPNEPTKRFVFRQKYIQNEGGWCAGISTVLAEGAISKAIDGIPTPSAAYKYFESTCASLSHLKSKGRLSESKEDNSASKGLLEAFKKRQRQMDMGPFGVNAKAGYVYTFGGRGVALLNLQVDKTTSIWVYGAWYQWRMTPIFLASMNHAGAVVWDSKEIFVFDPNVGGSLWNMPSWSFSALLRYSAPARIDEALDYMYKADAENKHRRSRVRSTAILRYSSSSAPVKKDIYIV